METGITKKIFRRHIALTNEHGSWVFFLSPLLIGLFIGGRLSTASYYLIFGSLAGFLVRQPITVLVKIRSKRRSQRDLPAALFWVSIYIGIGLLMMLGLISQGYGNVLLLGIPVILIFVWHLYLVSNRSERRQMGVEIVASGVLALVAPAAIWIGRGGPDLLGILVWFVLWLQSAASIVYAFLRLEQRELSAKPDQETRFRMARRALMYVSFNLLVVIGLSLMAVFPQWLFLPFGLQWVETVWGAENPAVGWRPNAIGIRQLIVSSLFTVLFIFLWGV